MQYTCSIQRIYVAVSLVMFYIYRKTPFKCTRKVELIFISMYDFKYLSKCTRKAELIFISRYDF